MKTRYLITLGVLAFSQTLFSQVEGFRTGTRIGLGESQLSSTRFSETPKGKLHLQLGGMMVYGFNEWLSLRADLTFNYTSGLARGTSEIGGVFGGTYAFTDEYRFFALSLPVGLRMGFSAGNFRPYAEIGGALQANLFATESRTYDNGAVNDDYGYADRKMNSLNALSQDFFFGVGAELATETGKAYFLEARFFNPLNAMGTIDQQNFSMRVLSIGGGVLFD